MSACNLPLELRDEGIKIKEYLKHGHHESEAVTIDYFCANMIIKTFMINWNCLELF